MNDRMAVRADWSKVAFRVDAVVFSDRSKRRQMVDVDEPHEGWAVGLPEVEATHDAPRPIVTNAGIAGSAVTLISIDSNLNDAAFGECGVGRNLLGRDRRGTRLEIADSNVAWYLGYAWHRDADVLPDAQIAALSKVRLSPKEDIAILIEQSAREALQLVVPMTVVDIERMRGTIAPELVQLCPSCSVGHSGHPRRRLTMIRPDSRQMERTSLCIDLSWQGRVPKAQVAYSIEEVLRVTPLLGILLPTDAMQDDSVGSCYRSTVTDAYTDLLVFAPNDLPPCRPRDVSFHRANGGTIEIQRLKPTTQQAPPHDDSRCGH